MLLLVQPSALHVKRAELLPPDVCSDKEEEKSLHWFMAMWTLPPTITPDIILLRLEENALNLTFASTISKQNASEDLS